MGQTVSEEAGTILAVLIEENRKRREGRKWLFWLLGGGTVVLLILMLINFLVSGRRPEDISSLASLVAMIGVSAAFTSSHRAALESAKKLADPRFAGYFAEALSTAQERDVKEICTLGLLNSLPLVQNAAEIEDSQLGYLYRLVKPTQEPKLLFEVLEAIRRVGGSEGVAPLEIFRDHMAKSSAVDAQSLHDLTSMVLAEIKLRTARKIIESRSLVTTPPDSEERVSVDSQ